MKSTVFHKIIKRDKGIFHGRNFSISTDSVTWIHVYSLFITPEGQLFSSEENENHYLLLQSLQSCHVQVFPNMSSASTTSQLPTLHRLKKGTASPASGTSADEPPVVFIKTFDNEKLYIKITSKTYFTNLIAALMVWQYMKPQGLVKKWYWESGSQQVVEESRSHLQSISVLVCRCKVYGPIPSRNKNITIVHGPKAPTFNPDSLFEHQDSHLAQLQNQHGSQGMDNVNEGWFFAMGVLKSDGILNFITELDGTLLYSVDMTTIFSSEIRQVHHSIFDNSNTLFLGQLRLLRANNSIKTVSPSDQLLPPFLTKDGKPTPNNGRLMIQFPLHIDLEDWFVGLNYFARREYIGSFSPKIKSNQKPNSSDKQNDENVSGFQDTTVDESFTSATSGSDTSKTKTSLLEYKRESFRVTKKLKIDLIEAKFNKDLPGEGGIYAEVYMWGYPWSRTAPVKHANNPFWKEEFSTDLPILTQMVHILIKKSTLARRYGPNDELVGTVFLTPDILNKQGRPNSTLIQDANGTKIRGHDTPEAPLSNITNDIVRLSIYDLSNIVIGKLVLTANLKEFHILSPNHFKSFENMLANAPMKDLIKYCNDTIPTSEIESVSMLLLDVFQTLGVEDDWFKALMEMELVNVDMVTRKNYAKKSGSTSSSNNVFNTLFRGSSIFSKSLENYNLRIGQEYLEKVFGDFFSKISTDKRNCEVDPRYVRAAIVAAKKGDADSDYDDSDDYDSDEEKEIDDAVRKQVDSNFNNLLGYCEEIWDKICKTSKDLPEQIKKQLKNFRTKVELACDPEDKVTALNCLSAFIFLRFFCPAILNPKLFYLTKDHQTGDSQRTLTLLAKVLLNLANRQEFSPHKEPHLVRMNDFLKRQEENLFDYYDKITGRKNDFNEKILELSHDMKRFDLGLSDTSTSLELPTNPYLIDKYHRLTELVQLLDLGKYSANGHDSVAGSIATSGTPSVSRLPRGPSPYRQSKDSYDLGGGTAEIQLDDKRNVYQIGSLEFEKSEFLDLAGDDETEGFIKSLCRSNEDIFSFIASNITLKDLQKRSYTLCNTINDLEQFLETQDVPSNYQGDSQMWEALTNEIMSHTYLDINRNAMVFIQSGVLIPSNYKSFAYNALSHLKLRFPENDVNIAPSSSSTSLYSAYKPEKKSIFKRLMKKT